MAQKQKWLGRLLDELEEIEDVNGRIGFGLIISGARERLPDEGWRQIGGGIYGYGHRPMLLLNRPSSMDRCDNGCAAIYWSEGSENGFAQFKESMKKWAALLRKHPDAMPSRQSLLQEPGHAAAAPAFTIDTPALAIADVYEPVRVALESRRGAGHCELLRDLCILARRTPELSSLVQEEVLHDVGTNMLLLEVRSIGDVGKILRHLCDMPVEKPELKPVWDARLRELRFDGKIIKVFKSRDTKQEVILAAFQEEGWPEVIDDPLWPAPAQTPQGQLRQTIDGLNRSHREKNRIHFGAINRGTGIRWERVESGQGRRRRHRRGQRK